MIFRKSRSDVTVNASVKGTSLSLGLRSSQVLLFLEKEDSFMNIKTVTKDMPHTTLAAWILSPRTWDTYTILAVSTRTWHTQYSPPGSCHQGHDTLTQYSLTGSRHQGHDTHNTRCLDLVTKDMILTILAAWTLSPRTWHTYTIHTAWILSPRTWHTHTILAAWILSPRTWHTHTILAAWILSPKTWHTHTILAAWITKDMIHSHNTRWSPRTWHTYTILTAWIEIWNILCLKYNQTGHQISSARWENTNIEAQKDCVIERKW